MRRRIVRMFAAAGVVAATMFAATPPALATTNDASARARTATAVSLSAAPSAAGQTITFGATSRRVAGPPVITCNVFADHPHNSGHVPGTVNFVGRGECTAAVGSIDIVVGLFLGNRVVGSGGRVVPNTASASKNAAAPCVPGTYVGNTDVIFFAPPGYEPPAIRLVKDSAAVSLTC